MSKIIGVLTAKPSRRKKKSGGEPWKVIDTFQQRLANRQEAHNLMTEYDMDHSGREKSLWEEALEVIRSTTMAERTIRYITLNKPEVEETAVPEAMMPTDAILRNISLPEMATRTPLKQQLPEPSWSPPQLPEDLRNQIKVDYSS